MIFALGVAMVGVMLATVLADYPLDQSRGKLAGLAVLLNSLGAMLTFALMSRLPHQLQSSGVSELWSGRLAYWIAAACCVLSALVMLGLRPGRFDPIQPHAALGVLIRQGIAAGRRPRIALAYGGSFMARADLVIVALFLALWAHNAGLQAGLSAADAAKRQGLLLAFVQLCALLWSPVFGWLADRVHRVSLLLSALALSAAGYGWLGLLHDPLSATTLPAAALVGVGQTSGMLATQVLIGQEAPEAIRGSVVGMLGFFGALGILVIARLGGYAFDHWRPGAPFLIMAMANVALLGYGAIVRWRSSPG
jgi:MFS family permease